MIDNKKTPTNHVPVRVADPLIPFRYKGNWGFCNHQKEMVIQPRYDLVSRFSFGLAKVFRKGKYGFVNLAGEVQIPLQYDSAQSFRIGRAIVGDNHQGTCIIDPDNRQVFPYTHGAEIGPFSGDGYATIITGGKHGIIDWQGKVTFFSDSYLSGVRQGRVRVSKEGRWGYNDLSGKEVIPCIYDEMEGGDSNIFRVTQGEKKGYIDIHTGQWVLDTSHYQATSAFVEGRIVCIQNDKYGYIDLDGNTIVEPKYDSASVFSEGRALVYSPGYTGYIDVFGRENYPLEFEQAGFFHEGLARVLHEGKQGYIDRNLNLVIDVQYDYAKNFRNGLTRVGIGLREWGYIDQRNNRYWED